MKEKLEALLLAFELSRGVGHTDALLKGLDGIDNAVVIIGNVHVADYIKLYATNRENIRFVSYSSPRFAEHLSGLHCPIVIDNSATMLILRDAVRAYDSGREAAKEEVKKLLEVL